MTKTELKKELLEMGEDPAELKGLTKDELMELYENYTDDSLLFPNGRDYDAEDW